MSAKAFSATDFKFVEKVPDWTCPHGHVCLALQKHGTIDEKLVIIKSLRQSLAAKVAADNDAELKKKYIKEANDLRMLGESYPDLNQLLGYSLHKDSNGRLAALLVWNPLLAMGPVVDVLETAKRTGNSVSFGVKCDWIRRILKTIQFLHEKNALNGNLKARNVFVDENFGIALTDYSTSSWFDLENLTHPLYQSSVSPEFTSTDNAGNSLRSSVDSSGFKLQQSAFRQALPYLSLKRLVGELSPDCDIYSLGVVCWEIVTGNYVDTKRIYDGVVNAQNMATVCHILNGFFNHLPLPPDTPVEILEILRLCGVGALGQSIESVSIDYLCERYEHRLAVLSTRFNRDQELNSLKSLNLETEHIRRIKRCRQAQDRRRGVGDVATQSSHLASQSVQLEGASVTINQFPQAPQIQSSASASSLPPASVSQSSITSVTGDARKSTPNNGFQQLVMDQAPARNNQMITFHNVSMGTQNDYGFGERGGRSPNLRIMTQNLQNTNFIQNSIVTINVPPVGATVSKKEEKPPDPIPPPRGVLTESGEQIDRADEKLLNKNCIPIKKWEKLAKNLGLSDGDAENLKLRHEAAGLAELCCRLLEFWIEKEATEATKKKLALALWMADEQELAKKIQ